MQYHQIFTRRLQSFYGLEFLDEDFTVLNFYVITIYKVRQKIIRQKK